MKIEEYLKDRRFMIDSYLRNYFNKKFKPIKLFESMTYSLFAGGKRLRPILSIASYEACGGKSEDILPQASSIELIHTYSLIHDDLPAMDNDDLRRGKPTNHKVFGEAIAILAGDALLTEAFVMFLNNNIFSSELLLKALKTLAIAAGPTGMVGGQAEDILSENKKPTMSDLYFIHTHKTGALIEASVKIGPILAEASNKEYESLSKYGERIGLAFQIIDDILDITGLDEKLGKKTGADIQKGKMTYPSLYGIEYSRKEAERLIYEAINAISCFNKKAEPLKAIAEYIIKRVE